MIRLGIRVRAGDAEVAFARLEPVLAGGSEQIDAGETFEYALYGDSLPSDADLRALAGDTIIALTRSPVAAGWERAWHAHLERVVIGDLAVRPPWLAGEPGDLVIDPGTTFGAASHPTTGLCLELLASRGAGPLADWGTGSGILAIAAARLGFAPVTAIELDPAAADTARSNAAANNVDIDVITGDVTQAPWAPTVVANLTLPLLESLTLASPPHTLIASGVLATHADRVAPALGLVERDRREAGGWAALVLERP